MTISSSNLDFSNDTGSVKHTVVLPCSTSMNVLQWGERSSSRPVCILLHGLDNNAHIWEPLAQVLQHKFTVFAIDFRGHGDSSWSQRDSYTIENLTNDVYQVSQYFNLSKFCLVGHSLGGRVAACFSVTWPNVVTALVLADIAPKMNPQVRDKMVADLESEPASFASEQAWFEFMETIYFLGDRDALRSFAPYCIKPARGQYVTKTDAFARKGFLDRLVNEDSHFTSNLIHLLTEMEAPFLLLRGEYSAVLTQTAANHIVANAEKSSLKIVSNAGHALMLDAPNETVSAIETYLNKYAVGF